MLSVIIPTYRRTDSLKRLLELLQVQSIAKEMEVIIIDQNERGFLEKEIALSGFSNVKSISSDHPNVALARNMGAMHAKHNHLLFLDDDLVPGRDFCGRGMDFFNTNSFVECFTPWIKTDTAQTDALAPVKNNIIKKISDQVFLITDTVSAAVFITKEAFLRSGGFDTDLFEFAKTAEDQEFFLRFRFKGINLFYTPSFSIFHDETKPGGCDLRTADYWVTREKCIKAWVYRYKIHRGGRLAMRIPDYIRLYRSVFLNRGVLISGVNNIKRQVQLLKKALAETNAYLKMNKEKYTAPAKITHLKAAGDILYKLKP